MEKKKIRLQNSTNNSLIYETSELKLAALLLAEIPDSSVDVHDRGNSIRKSIVVAYPAPYSQDVQKLEKDYINKEAKVSVYAYNRALNLIRDRLRGRDNNGFFQKQ
jgi:hypothetical protein